MRQDMDLFAERSGGFYTVIGRRSGRGAWIALLFVIATITAMLAGLPSDARAQGNQNLYTDNLSSTWQNWSWCRTDFASADVAHTGSRSLKVSLDSSGMGLYLHCSPQSDTLYSSLVFWIHGGSKTGRKLAIAGVLNNAAQISVALDSYIDGGVVTAGQWHRVIVPLTDLRVNAVTKFCGFEIVDTSGGPQLPFYMDDIYLGAGLVPRPPPAPLNLTAAPGNGAIALAWTASVGASSYSVKRSLVSGGPYTTVAAGLGGTTYLDAGLLAGTTCYYVVTATSSVGESGLSNQASATTLFTPNLTGLFSTGLDNWGFPLADGLQDAHYTLVSMPSGGGAYAPFVTLQKSPIQPSLWLADSAASKWISPSADESLNTDLPGTYIYETTFTVSGNPARVGVSGRALADNQITAIVLNGVTIVAGLPASLNVWGGFTLGSGFVAGTNTLRFTVVNTGASVTNPSGFRCELIPYSY